MSLITDTLNKMKKEQGSEENDEKMMAPPALRNAVINTKKYQEFVKNAEIKDINGNKAPLKGFVTVSVVLFAVIVAALIYFLNKEDNTLIKHAGIVSNNQQSAQAVNSSNNVKSLGKPYNPDLQNNQQKQTAVSADINKKPAPDQNMQGNNNTDTQPFNDMQGRQTQAQMVSMPDSHQESNVKKENTKTQVKQDPVNIIPANQLFIVTPQSAPVNNEITEKPAQSNLSPAVNTKQNNKPAAEKQNISSNDKAENGSKVNFAEISQENIKKANEYTQKQVDEEKARAEKNAQAIQENYAVNNQNSSLNKSSIKDYADKIEIAEVKAIKTKDPSGTVSASTISLYNQYVTTGNKAKNEGQYERAIEYYTNALNSKYFLESSKLLQYANTLEKSSYILFANGYYSQSQGQYDAAVQFYKDAMAVNPADVSSAYYAALCFEEQGKNSDAVEMYKYIINNSSSPENMKKQASSKVKKLGS